MGELVRAVRLVSATAFRADRRSALAVILLYLARSAGSVTTPFWFKLLADAATAGDSRRALLAGGGGTATIALAAFVGTLGANASQQLQERTGLLIDERLASLALGVPGVEHYEHPRYLNTLTLLREERGLLAQALGATLEFASLLAGLVLTAVLLASVHPALLLLPACGVAFLLTGRIGQRSRQRAREATAERARAAEHLFDLATSADAGKELRVFGLEDELVGRYRRLWAAIDRERTRAGLQGAALDAAAWLLFALGYAGAVVFALRLAVDGAATAGDVLLTLGLAGQVHGYVGNFTYLFGWLLGALRAVGRLFWLEGYAAADDRARRLALAAGASDVPARLSRGIDLEGVSFRYPGTGDLALADVTLHLPAGATVALVGENGAGKTTLVKLLCRLYEPSAGRVAADGVDLRAFAIAAWRARLAAGFQDVARFELLVRETVGVGDLPLIASAPAVEAALERAGAGDLPAALPGKLETQLGQEWEGGVELSGGQWQKLALGRAMMRERPLLLILDEPTASLDAQAEHDLFERYAQAAKQTTAEAGTITILVSHRFSTVRMADLIVVLENGRVTGAGSHEELLAAGGLYAELYALQAGQYR